MTCYIAPPRPAPEGEGEAKVPSPVPLGKGWGKALISRPFREGLGKGSFREGLGKGSQLPSLLGKGRGKAPTLAQHNKANHSSLLRTGWMKAISMSLSRHDLTNGPGVICSISMTSWPVTGSL